jgi:hypothetical protein
MSTLKLHKRSEVIVRIPVENGIEGAEGLIEKIVMRGCLFSQLLNQNRGQPGYH